VRPAIIKYNAGNIQSVLFALERIGVKGIVTDDAKLISSADKVIFPGVGEASTAMKYLEQKGLADLIPALQQPVLGICLGMQLMCGYSEENSTKCLDIFPGVAVKKFISMSAAEKVPQVGWNNIYDLQGSLFQGIGRGSYCYFVHSYYAEKSEYTIATTDYITPYSSAMQKGNFFGVQFHPEKSAKAGEQILKNFLSL
jgi:glutamine amidotransferase